MPGLFTPLKLGSTTLNSRLGMSPMTRNRSSATVPNEIMRQYYEQRARGGAGLIIAEATLITRQGSEWPNAPGIWNQAQVAGWRRITDSVHAHDTKIYSQLAHGGRCLHPDAPEQIASGQPVWGPSAIAARGGSFRFLPGNPGFVTPTELDEANINTIIAQFKEAAINAKEAGFDGVELHGSTGLLVHQFLDSTANQRTDKWGGSPENRARFALEVLKALKEVFGSNVALKLGPTSGYNDVGMPLQETIDTYGYLLREASKLGLAYVVLVRYRSTHDPEFDGKKRGTPHDVVETYGPLLDGVPLFVNGLVSPTEAEELIQSGKAAGVLMGVPWLTHPDLARRIQAGKVLDNVPDVRMFYNSGADPGIGYLDYKEAVY
ncbi:hypothetical protein FB45DRAFT_312665 [Roridomyces roridus]|uniref:NADH:flavin oxidoreductase/NADH oxidase N-terminal domain-containing protein n=1 Tax=Roridomyces roridus TaxID=1738132 RepID=A0AAD7FCA2_9AGAR|nr:hypothetical protein FB45DRAFT_312665 [Roridomyces roridus]